MSPRKPTDEELDEELEGTFPASDPPSLTEPVGDARKRAREDEAPKKARRPGRPRGPRPAP